MCGEAGQGGKAREAIGLPFLQKRGLIHRLFEKWGCIGIRQDVSGSSCCNQGIAPSSLKSVRRKLDAKTSMKDMVAKFMDAQGMGNRAFAPVAVMA